MDFFALDPDLKNEEKFKTANRAFPTLEKVMFM